MLFLVLPMKDDLSQKIHRKIILSLCLVKTIFHFSINMILLFCQRGKMILPPKKTFFKNVISCIIERNDILPRKCNTSFDRKNKEDELVSLM